VTEAAGFVPEEQVGQGHGGLGSDKSRVDIVQTPRLRGNCCDNPLIRVPDTGDSGATGRVDYLSPVTEMQCVSRGAQREFWIGPQAAVQDMGHGDGLACVGGP
jgi:hypothetical protein